MESETGRNNLQMIVVIIIFRRNKFLIIVICCCVNNKMMSVYFLISSAHSAITHNTHAIHLTMETGNCLMEITLSPAGKVTQAEGAI